jgi:hypothetical protein
VTPPTWLHWPASWTPADLADLRAWYKADAITGLSDGDPVSTWSDSSGGGYDLTQTSTARPLYQTNTLNGLPVVEFDGTDDTLDASTAADWKFLHDSTGSSVFFVIKVGTSSDPNAIYGIAGNNATASANHGWCVFYDDRASVPRDEVIVGSITRGSGGFPTAANVSSDNAMGANTAQLLGIVSDPANGTAANRSSMRVNGGTAIANNAATDAASTSNPTYTFQLGAAGNDAFPMLGYIAEVIICDAILSSTDREKVEGYLAHKWGLESNLPNTHPYRYSAP